MNWSRRQFLAAAAAARTVRGSTSYFGIHPFIEAHPKAVFIHRTHVKYKMDAAAKRAAGLGLAREIFVPMDRPGIPLTHRIILKPNFTSLRRKGRPDTDFWGTGTDPDFYEGILIALKELGLSRLSFIETNSRFTWNYRGLVDINERYGVDMNDTDHRLNKLHRDPEIVWEEIPEAVVYRRIPYLAPVNEADTWLLDISKWKAHGMGLTLSVKNEQGLVAVPYVRFCAGWNMVTEAPDAMKPDIVPDAHEKIMRYFEAHRRMGYDRYDLRDPEEHLGPIVQEIWAQKTCDSQSVLRTGFAMIEGIYARDGDGFAVGRDYMANMVMFSKDQFRLDLIGFWLGGHEPGDINLFRIAKERGLTDTFNPWEVPIYEWVDGKAVERKLTDFPRTPLKSKYLRRPGEPFLHLVNDPFDYDKITI